MAKAGTTTAIGERPPARSEETRLRLVDAAVEALREEGFGGASAREIARRAGCNQGLVFYYFGSVGNLLLAALDAVSARRLDRYRTALEEVDGISGLVDVAELVFREDLDTGHMAVLAEMIAGSSSTPGLGSEVAARIAPWRDFTTDALRAALRHSGLPELIPAEEAAHAIVALYLGLEMLAHLEGDRSRAIELFAQARQMAHLFVALGGADQKEAGR
jgi:AcrR family transcriptional regulator